MIDWRSVEDGLPEEEYVPVLIQTDDSAVGYQVAYVAFQYDGNDHRQLTWFFSFTEEMVEKGWSEGRGKILKVTHWAPIDNYPDQETCHVVEMNLDET